jgi:hypothetical protein
MVKLPPQHTPTEMMRHISRLGDNPRFRVSIRISAWIIKYRYVSIQNRSRYRFLINYRPFFSLSFISFFLFPLFSYDNFSIKILLKYRFYLKQIRPSFFQLYQNQLRFFKFVKKIRNRFLFRYILVCF